MCVLQPTDEEDIGGHYYNRLEQGQCCTLTVLTLPQTAPGMFECRSDLNSIVL